MRTLPVYSLTLGREREFGNLKLKRSKTVSDVMATCIMFYEILFISFNVILEYICKFVS